jgi:hypothetical protein
VWPFSETKAAREAEWIGLVIFQGERKQERAPCALEID